MPFVISYRVYRIRGRICSSQALRCLEVLGGAQRQNPVGIKAPQASFKVAGSTHWQ